MKRWLKRALLAIAALFLAAVVAGVSYQLVGNWRDAREFQQPGKSVSLAPDFPGVFLGMDCRGAGSPTVILDSGLGVPAIGWEPAQQGIAEVTRVCSYDRAGYGWSSPGPMPRTSEQIALELHTLLKNSGEKPPYVLIAHSFGGYNVRVYTARYPGEVAGLVLVDTSHEDQVKFMSPGMQKFMKDEGEKMQWEMKLAPLLVYSGVARLTTPLDEPKSLSLETRRELRYLQLQPKYLAATSSEMGSFETSAAQVRQAGDLGQRPLVVLTAGKVNAAGAGLPQDLQKDLADFQKVWISDLQVRESKLSSRGKQVVVAESDHMIPIERPQAVVDAAKEVIQAVRSEASLPDSAANK
jgi:pimeloyl-ACP methyl ester carboxylesterase